MTNTQQFEKLVDEYFSFTHRTNPTEATEKGIHLYDSELERFDKNSLKENYNQLLDFEKRFKEIKRDDLDTQTLNDLLIIESDLHLGKLHYNDIKYYEISPTMYINAVLYGVFVLILRDFAPLEERAISITSRLKQTPRVLSEGKANLFNPPAILTEVAIESADEYLEFYEKFIPEVANKLTNENLKNDLINANNLALDSVKDYISFLKNDLLPRSNGKFAVGKDVFDSMLRYGHLLDYDSESLLVYGESVINSTKIELEKIAKEINPSLSWQEILEEIKDEHPSADELLDFYREEVRRARDFIIKNNIVGVPEDEMLEVIETPPFERSISTYGGYIAPPPFEKNLKGFFYVTPIDTSMDKSQQEAQLKGHSKHRAPSFIVHEAYPGHHLQLLWANMNPSKVRKELASNVFCEGWALYCEEMMKEQGYYKDKKDIIGQLQDQLWRAVRIIIDVKLHTEQMSYESAVNFLVDEAHLEKVDAIPEVRRYLENPTQPMSYQVGKGEIMKIRDEYKKLKGSDFSLKEFHEKLLKTGSPPLKIVWNEVLSDKE